VAEIEAVPKVPGILKGKKGAFIGIGIAAVAIFAVVMRSQSSGTAAATTDNTGANLAGLGNAMQQANADLQAHLDASNATMASSIADFSNLTAAQGTEISTLQDQIKTSLSNESSIVGSIGSLTTAVDAQAHQGAPVAPSADTIVKSIFGASADITSAMTRWGGSGYKFVNTEGMAAADVTKALKAAGGNGLIVGGYNAGGGVTTAMAAGTGVNRVAGQSLEDTAKLIQSIQF
jgi:hypothetical protein